jgi:hypothetical protein
MLFEYVVYIYLFLFFQQHFKESQTYLVRYNQCLNEALNLVKTHVIDLFKYATAQVTASRNVSFCTSTAFLFHLSLGWGLDRSCESFVTCLLHASTVLYS